ncbi:MAG: AsmA family protein [Bacteroidales bacterium]
MKKIIKVFTWLVVIFILLVIALAVTSKLAENKITDIALKKVSENINAPVTIDDVSFNLLRKFPYATIELYGVTLGSPQKMRGSDSSITTPDTIFQCKKLYVSVKSKPLLENKFEIVKIDIDGAHINYQVDTTGTTNVDFLLDSEEDTTVIDTVPAKPLSLILNNLSAWNIVINYNDELLKTKANVKIPNLKVNAEIQVSSIHASVVGQINLTKCSFNNTNLYLMNNTNIDLDIDYRDDSVRFKHLKVDTDGAGFSLSGNVILGDVITTDIKLSETELYLNELIKYAPNEILKEYGVDHVKGKVNLDATVKGVYSEFELPKVDFNISFKDGNLKTADYPELKNISFAGKATNGILRNNQSTQADFSSLHFETEKSKFDIAFSLLDLDHPKYTVNTTMDINVGEFKRFIPDSLIKNMDGNINATFSTKGELPDSIGDDFIDYLMANSQAEVYLKNLNVDVDSELSIKDFSTTFNYKPNHFSIEKLNVEVPVYNAELKNSSFNVDFNGSINNFSGIQLNIKSYHIETKGSEITGYAKVNNLDNPSYEFENIIRTNLSETKGMLPDSMFKILKGNVVINVKSKATLNMDSLSTQYMDIVFKKSAFQVVLTDVYAELYDYPLYTIERFNGIVSMAPEAITINKMSGIANGLDFLIDSTEIWNAYEVLILDNKKDFITVQTNIALGEINNNFLGAFMSSDSTVSETNAEAQSEQNTDASEQEAPSTDSVTTPLLPNLKELGIPHFLVRGKLSIDKIEYEKNIIDGLSLLFRFTDSLYVVDQFKMKTCQGELNTSFKLDARRWDKPVIDVKNYITGLDVKELLMRNDNFGDTTLTYEKVSGILTSEMHVRVFYEEGAWPTDRIRAQGHFTLEDGKIYDYEPLVDLSKNKILGGLKELDKLDFNTLTTSLFMYKDKIYIPETDIVTSSMDITAFAMHSLKDEYEYHLKIHLGDVLTGKSEKILKEQAKQNKKDGSNVERSGIKLVSMKKDGNKKNGFDNEKLEKEFLKDLNKQQGWLQLLFNPFLVNFNTDLDRTKRNQEIIEKYGSNK